MGAVVVDGKFEIVDLAIGIDDVLDAADFTGAVGVDGGGNLSLDQTAHLQHAGAQAGEVFVKLAGKVQAIVHVFVLVSPCGR